MLLSSIRGVVLVQKENVLLSVETLKDSFTKTESRIASFVLENPKKVIYMSLTELSDALKVSEGSIVRFCQKAGFRASSFKIAMAMSESPARRDRESPIESLMN